MYIINITNIYIINIDNISNIAKIISSINNNIIIIFNIKTTNNINIIIF